MWYLDVETRKLWRFCWLISICILCVCLLLSNVYCCQLVYCVLDVSADVASRVGGRWQRGRGTISEMCNLSQSPCASILNTFCAIIPFLNVPFSSLSNQLSKLFYVHSFSIFICIRSFLSQDWCAFIFKIFKYLHVFFLNFHVPLFSISVKFSLLICILSKLFVLQFHCEI